jgi:hypothetical protein
MEVNISSNRYFIFGVVLFLISMVMFFQSFKYQVALCELESGKILMNREDGKWHKNPE